MGQDKQNKIPKKNPVIKKETHRSQRKQEILISSEELILNLRKN